MKKFLKTIGKILSIPINIIIILLTIPIGILKFISMTLQGRLNQLKLEQEFATAMLKFTQHGIFKDEPFFVEKHVSYGNENVINKLKVIEEYKNGIHTVLRQIIKNDGVIKESHETE